MSGFAGLVQRDGITHLRNISLCLVDRWLNDRMSEREIMLPDELLVFDESLGASFVAVSAPFVSPPGETCVGHVYVVRCATHEAHRMLCDPLESAMPPK